MLFSSPGDPHLFAIQPPCKVHFTASCSPRISLRDKRGLRALSSIPSFANEQEREKFFYFFFSVLLARNLFHTHCCGTVSSWSRCCPVLKLRSSWMPGEKGFNAAEVFSEKKTSCLGKDHCLTSLLCLLLLTSCLSIWNLSLAAALKQSCYILSGGNMLCPLQLPTLVLLDTLGHEHIHIAVSLRGVFMWCSLLIIFLERDPRPSVHQSGWQKSKIQSQLK